MISTSLPSHDLWRLAAVHSRVALTGYGADPAMLGSATYALSLLKSGAWGRLAADLWHSLTRGYFPKVGFRARVRRWLRRACSCPPLPIWLNRELVARLDLGARWFRVQVEEWEKPGPHPRRAEAWRCLTAPFWPHVFEGVDPGVTLLPVEHRHPFFDLRVLTYLLAIPPLPWCDNKEVLRSAMAGSLPDAVRLRPKAYLAPDPNFAVLRREESAWVDRFEAAPELEAYVVRDRVPRFFGRRTGTSVGTT